MTKAPVIQYRVTEYDEVPFATVGVPHSIIPAARRKRTRERARRGALSDLRSLLEFRKDMDDWKAEGVLMLAYAEQAEDMGLAVDTLRAKIYSILGFTDEDLKYWVNNRVSFEHFETARRICPDNPRQLLMDCIEKGNEYGNVMTVDEMETYHFGGKKRFTGSAVAKNLISRLLNLKIVSRWGEDKRKEYYEWLKAGERFFQ